MIGFHLLKDSPSQQMEAHHFCRQINEDFASALCSTATRRGQARRALILQPVPYDLAPEIKTA